MSSQVYVGNKYALTFPVMCDGYLRIDYSDNVAAQDYGIFDHEDSFTVEAIITPFDINGAGWKIASHAASKGNNPAGTTGVSDSIKTMPTVQEYNMTATNHQSHKYRPEANRITDKMMVFYNGSVQLYLQNATLTTHNQPAEYKIGMAVVAGSTSDTLLSDISIASSLEHTGEGTVFHGEDSRVKYEPFSFTDATCDTDTTAGSGSSFGGNPRIIQHNANAKIVAGLTVYGKGIPAGATIASITSSTLFVLSADVTETLTNTTLTFGLTVDAHIGGQATFTYNGGPYADAWFSPKQELFVRDGQTFTSIGTVNAAANNTKTVTLDAAVAADLDDKELYTHTNREALYLANSFHIAWSFHVATGNMTIYLNGERIATKKHSNAAASAFDFSFEAEDCYMGQDPNTGTSTQFMGKMHEFAILDGYKTEFNSVFTLAPNYNKTLLYYRFEEAGL